MSSIRKILIGVATVASLGIVSVTSAQVPGQGPGPGFGPGFGPGAGMGPGRHAGPGLAGAPGANFDPVVMVENRLGYAKTALKISGDQEDAWGKLAAAVKAQAGEMKKVRAAALAETKTSAPDRMAQRIALAKLHVANLEALQGPVNDLYGKLTAEQKAVADKLIGRMHRRMGRAPQ